jgi:hypothetical protein
MQRSLPKRDVLPWNGEKGEWAARGRAAHVHRVWQLSPNCEVSQLRSPQS